MTPWFLHCEFAVIGGLRKPGPARNPPREIRHTQRYSPIQQTMKLSILIINIFGTCHLMSLKLGSRVGIRFAVKWTCNIYMVQRRPPPPPCGWVMVPPPPLWLWGCGGALLVSDAADFLWFLVPPPPPVDVWMGHGGGGGAGSMYINIYVYMNISICICI